MMRGRLFVILIIGGDEGGFVKGREKLGAGRANNAAFVKVQ